MSKYFLLEEIDWIVGGKTTSETACLLSSDIRLKDISIKNFPAADDFVNCGISATVDDVNKITRFKLLAKP
jgi:hypothetical protein